MPMMPFVGLSLALALSMERERAENERFARMTSAKTQEELEREYLFRKKQMEDIQRIFADIRAALAPAAESETLLAGIYKELNESVKEFEDHLIAETAVIQADNTTPLITAQKLQATMSDALNETSSLEEKTRSITDFRDYARNAKHSEATKTALGALIGGIVATTILFAGLIALTGGFSILFSSVGAAFFLMCSAPVIGMGICMGAILGLDLSKNQDDSRGRDVSSHLKTLVAERNKLYHKPVKTPVEVLPYSTALKFGST